MRIKGYLLFILFSYQTFSLAQTKHFQHITNADGISQSEVYTFLEDSRGFLWFGTIDGLNQYDGYDIKIFYPDKFNPNSISNNTVRSLAEDSFGRIWIGTDDGLCVYSPSSEKIVQVRIACIDDHILLRIRTIIVDKDYLLLVTSSGLMRANINTSNLEQIGQELKLLNFSYSPQLYFTDAILCKDGRVWISTQVSLIGMVFQNENINPVAIESVEAKEFENIVGLEEDKFGNIWIVSQGYGLFRYKPSTKKLDHFTVNLSNHTIISMLYSSVVSDKNDNIWISTMDNGLLFLDASKLNDANPQFENIKNVSLDENSLNSNLLYSLYVSSKNLLWIGTIGSGINLYDPHQKEFNCIKIPQYGEQFQSSSNFIRAVYADNDSNIWLGTHNNGLYIFNRKNNSFSKAGFGTQSVFYIYDIGGGNILICSSDGVSYLKLVNNEVKNIKSIFSGAHFYALKSKDDIVWIASLTGLRKCRLVNGTLQPEQFYTMNSTPGISYSNCRILFYNREKDELLVGTEGGGLNIIKLDEQHNAISVEVYKKGNSSNSINSNYIRSIIRDSRGDIWIGTYEGLNKLLRDSGSSEIFFKSYTKNDGLPNNMIQSLVEDNQKNIWIGTNGGISKFDSQNEQFVNYTVREGLQSNEFSEHTVFKKADGEIIIGGINGINMFYPDKIRLNTIPPKTAIIGFYLFNKKVEISEGKNCISPLIKSIILTDSIFLKPNQNSFGFDFSAMLHSYSGKINYAYKLEGFDKNWNYTDAKNRRANYTNLRHGKYVFLVKSTNTDGLWEDQSRHIYIQIRTPFYFTWFAYVLYILIIILIIVYFTNYSIIKYTTKKKIFLDNMHNKRLHELDELRSRFFINISHDLRTPLSLISSPLELVMKTKDFQPEVEYHLNLIRQNVKKLISITEQLLDFSKAEAGKLVVIRQNQDIVSFIKMEAAHFIQAIKSKGLELYIMSNEEAINTDFDADMISKVFFNLMSNAIKYTQKGEISIRIERVSQELPEPLLKSKYNSFLRIEIQDSGVGIDQQELDKVFNRFYQGKSKTVIGYGIGLSHSKDLVEAQEGLIDVFSEKDVGTKFRIFIPHIKSEENQEDKKFITANSEDVYITPFNDISIEDTSTDNDVCQKILVVEDNTEMLHFIRYELKKEYKVLEADDGLQGLEMARKFFPDLIVSDIMMPNMDGIELCKKIKSDINTSHIPVILLTAKVDNPSKYEGVEVGADDFISKPFDINYLILRIKNLLKSREQLKRLFQINNYLSPSAVTVSSIDEKFLSHLMNAIENGISNPEFTVNSLESTMAMSHSNFYRKIKILTGQSGKVILLSMRMKRAKQILTDNPDIRISEVAFMVGYSNPKYFGQSFKEFYGILPSEINQL